MVVYLISYLVNVFFLVEEFNIFYFVFFIILLVSVNVRPSCKYVSWNFP